METYDTVLDALGDRSRRVIIKELRAGPAAVGELAQRIAISRPAISQHLKVLQACRLVDYDTVGTRHLYRLDPSGLQALRSWVDGFWDEVLTRFASYTSDQVDTSKVKVAHPREATSDV